MECYAERGKTQKAEKGVGMMEKAKYDILRPDMKTGDCVLFSGKGRISEAIKWFSCGKYSHVGVLVVIQEYDLVALWESTTLSNVRDLESGQYRKGVQLVDFSRRLRHYSGTVAYRPLREPLSPWKIEATADLRHRLKGRPYETDKIELVRSAYDGWLGDNVEEALWSIFCSELVAEFYQATTHLIGPPTGFPSNEYTPSDFSEKRDIMNFLGPETEIVY